jgi:multicomponent K+:H+ antiporter subunit D
MKQAGMLGALYFIGAIAVVGLPPLSGFIGKALILQSTPDASEQVWLWPAILVSSLIALVAFSRAGTSLFWHLSGNKPGTEVASRRQFVAIGLLLLAPPLMTIFAGPITSYTERAANDISASNEFILQSMDNMEFGKHDAH